MIGSANIRPVEVIYAIRGWKDYLLAIVWILFSLILIFMIIRDSYIGNNWWAHIGFLLFFGLPVVIFFAGLALRIPRLELFPEKVIFIDFFGVRRTVCTKTFGKAHPFVMRIRFNSIPQIGFLRRDHEQALLDAGRTVSKLNFDKTLSLQFMVPHDRLDEVVAAIEATRSKQQTERIDSEESERLAAYLLHRRRLRNLIYVVLVALSAIGVILFDIYFDT